MGMRQKRCPRCGKRRPFNEGTSPNDTRLRAKRWRRVDGVYVCRYCTDEVPQPLDIRPSGAPKNVVGFYGADPVPIGDPWADVVHHIEASETETFEPGKTTCGKDAARPPAGSVQGYSLEHNLALTTEPERASCPRCRDERSVRGRTIDRSKSARRFSKR